MLKKRIIKDISCSIFVIMMLTFPWYMYARLFLSKVERTPIVSFSIFVDSLLGYVWQIHTYFLPFVPILIICIYFFVRNKKSSFSMINKEKLIEFIVNRRNYRFRALIMIQIVLNIVMISLTTNFLDTRRLIGAIPFFYYILAVLLNYIIKKQNIIGTSALILCVFTNILHISPYLLINTLKIKPDLIECIIKPPLPYFNVDENWINKKADLESYLSDICKIESYFQYYVEELLNDYNDADKGIIKFLNLYSEPNQKVLIVGYQYETVAYYTNCQVVNRLDSQKDPLPSVFKAYPNAIKYEFLTYTPIEQCDWVIERRLDSGKKISHAIWHNESLFEKYYIDYPDAKPWNEIWDHSFLTDDSFEGVYIFRNKLTTKSIDLPSNKFIRDK